MISVFYVHFEIILKQFGGKINLSKLKEIQVGGIMCASFI